MMIKLIVILLTPLLIFGCKNFAFPEYWVCTGKSIQIVKNNQQETIERYEGSQRLILEIYGDVVSQFASPAAFGKYDLCENSKEILLFEYPKCEDVSEMSEQHNMDYKRWGVLQKSEGLLAFSEFRRLKEIKILSGGTYSCQYLGGHYSYKDLSFVDE